MDTVTQGMLGAVTAQLGFRRKIGRDATWVAAAAAVLPDLDVFVEPLVSLTGSEVSDLGHMMYHRGLSHSLPVLPLLALPVALMWWAVRRRVVPSQAPGAPPPDAATHPEVAARRAVEPPPAGPAKPFGLLYACVLVAMLSHPFLDWCTSYGTQLLAPITDTRYAFDALPIIDMIYTGLLLVTLVGCTVARKIARGPGVGASLAVGWVGFALSMGYVAAGRVLHDRAIERATAAIPAGTQVVRADAYPAIGTIFLWRTVVETPGGWWIARVHHFAPDDPKHVEKNFAPRTDNAWVDKAMDAPLAQAFRWFAMGRVRATHETVDGRHAVEFHDLRYGRSPAAVKSLWSVRVTMDRRGRILEAERVRHPRDEDFSDLAGDIWRDIWNPTP